MKSVLSIAGSDSSGGAGIQADVKTVCAHRLYAQTAITALTAQNTLGVTGVIEVDPSFVREQIDAVFSDIVPDAVKVGMVSNPGIIRLIAERLRVHGAQNIVVDPVMVATSGSRLISEDAVESLKEILLPIADLITPNLAEAEALLGRRIESREEMEAAARDLLAFGCKAVLVKGGHASTRADDVLATSAGDLHWFYGERIDTKNTHGTGCTLSSAIACNLALNFELPQAIGKAKDYVTGALHHNPHLGRGCGPLDHMWEYRNLQD